jgi:acid phosphatase family membrane protein YuiD
LGFNRITLFAAAPALLDRDHFTTAAGERFGKTRVSRAVGHEMIRVSAGLMLGTMNARIFLVFFPRPRAP